MIKGELVGKLLPAVQELIPKEDWHRIPELFEKVYKMKYNDNIEVYVLSYWGEEIPAVTFSTNNYEFIGTCTQEYAIKNGVLI